jgi:hypothetical protein
MMMLGSSITKRLDASWAVGINQGGLRDRLHRQHDVSHLADPQARHRVVDMLSSTSASSPTCRRTTGRSGASAASSESAAVVAFTQSGDQFRRAVVTDRSNTATQASTLVTYRCRSASRSSRCRYGRSRPVHLSPAKASLAMQEAR